MISENFNGYDEMTAINLLFGFIVTLFTNIYREFDEFDKFQKCVYYVSDALLTV